MVTYTYNDHALVDDLLESISSWTLRPSRIIVVDDGSTPSYLTDKATVIRLSSNHGFAEAKQAGISAVTGKFVLSLDCDIRLNTEWLYNNIQFAARQDIGIVTSGIAYFFHETIVDRYIKFYIRYPATEYTEKLNNGGAWLFQKDVWNISGGFSKFKGILSEDIWFSQEVYKKGYKLFSNKHAQAYEVRRYNRYTAVNRVWKGQWKSFREQLSEDSSFRDTLGFLLATFKLRINNELYVNEFAYIDILLFVYATIDTLRIISNNSEKNYNCVAFLSIFTNLISDYPKFQYNIKHDALELSKIEHYQEYKNCSNYPLEVYSSELISFFSRNTLIETEQTSLPKILNEHESIKSNFSSYDQL
ncbi:glycosyltransferase [Desulfonatronum sp. SC1]|uniref:glycosyltransferase family 2 protein n=1 Tax=Desulfonatronum sp. SC1 TaxID=2109626 RepID=UPI001304867A|nr:glycosyltransferase [Desulfonatronum sp. SC1]